MNASRRKLEAKILPVETHIGGYEHFAYYLPLIYLYFDQKKW